MEKKEFLVFWRDDARAVFTTQAEAEAYALDNAISQTFSDDHYVVCVVVAEVSKPKVSE